MDGRLLAQAREEKENIRRRALRTDRQRHEEAYARVPELQKLDADIAALVPRAAAGIMNGKGSLDDLRARSLELQARRAELLTAHGWPMDWLDGAWDCPICRDTGYVEGQMCDCLKKLYEKARVRDLSALLTAENESFGDFDLSYYDGRPDPVSGVSPRAQMETVYGLCKDYARSFGRGHMDLLFRGGTGLGKTFLSACIAREVARRDFSVVYETAVAAMDAYHDARGYDPDPEAEDKVRRMEFCDLLILDDLGTESVNSQSVSALYTLVNTRLTARKSTIISTNLTAEQMAARYPAAIVSRLEGEYQVLSFVGSDVRALKKARSLG